MWQAGKWWANSFGIVQCRAIGGEMANRHGCLYVGGTVVWSLWKDFYGSSHGYQHHFCYPCWFTCYLANLEFLFFILIHWFTCWLTGMENSRNWLTNNWDGLSTEKLEHRREYKHTSRATSTEGLNLLHVTFFVAIILFVKCNMVNTRLYAPPWFNSILPGMSHAGTLMYSCAWSGTPTKKQQKLNDAKGFSLIKAYRLILHEKISRINWPITID